MTDTSDIFRTFELCVEASLNFSLSEYENARLQSGHHDKLNATSMEHLIKQFSLQSQEYCQPILTAAVEQHALGDKDRYTRESITYYLTGIAGVTVSCLGILGNLLSLIVLTRKTMRTSTYCYLAALGVCDLLFVACTLAILTNDLQKPPLAVSSLQSSQSAGSELYCYLFPYLHAAAFTLQVGSIWLTLAFTVDRYIMICHPFQAEPFCTVGRARRVVAMIMIGCVAFNIPKFFEYRTVVKSHPPFDIQHVALDLSEFGSSKAFKILYHSWFYIVFVAGVPFIALAVLNSFLVHAVRISKRRCKEINNASEIKRTDTTVMLIGVVVIFFICQIPALVNRTIWAFEENARESFTRIPLFTLNEVANFLVILNSSINIVPYYFFGRRFRREFLQLFCGCLVKLDPDHNIFSWSLSRRESIPESHC